MKSFKTNGFVLNSHSFGDSHKLIHFFSEDMGQIKIIAHGIRKTLSKYGSSFELLNELSVVLISSKQKDLYQIKETQIISSYHTLRQDIHHIHLLYYLAEFLNIFAQENISDYDIYKLLRNTLQYALDYIQSFYVLVRHFELKSLSKLGFLSDIKLCSLCEKQIDETNQEKIFLTKRPGWLLCSKCSNPHWDTEISPGAYRYLCYLLNFDMQDILRLKMNDDTKQIIDYSIDLLIQSILGRKLNSSKWLNDSPSLRRE